MPDTVERALNIAIVAATADREERMSFQETRGQGKRVFAIVGNREHTPVMNGKGPQGKAQRSRDSLDGFAVREAGHNSRKWGGDGTPSRRSESRAFTGRRNQWPPVEGRIATEPKSGDDRCAPRPKGIQCYNCRQLGHTHRGCPRSQ